MMGAGELIVTNLFAWRATDPSELMKVDDPVGEENDREVLMGARTADIVVCAWGVHGAMKELHSAVNHSRGDLTERFLRKWGIRLFCLGKTKNGHPRHPLYVAYAKKLETF